MIEKRFVEDGEGSHVLVTFALPNTIWADAIYLVGDFNGWNPRSLPLGRDRAGRWSLTVSLKPDAAYQFRYLCDDERWITESGADATAPHRYAGGYNAVISTDRRPRPHT